MDNLTEILNKSKDKQQLKIEDEVRIACIQSIKY